MLLLIERKSGHLPTAAAMDAVDAALMESDERHKDAVRMVRLFHHLSYG